jgi:hypothetical protein
VPNLQPRELSDTLWSLAALEWHDPAVYSAMLQRLEEACRSEACLPQHVSRALKGCARARHWDAAADALAAMISRQGVPHW